MLSLPFSGYHLKKLSKIIDINDRIDSIFLKLKAINDTISNSFQY